VDEEDKTDGVTIRDALGREQNPVLINGSGVYNLIFSSKLPNAKEFKRWVTAEVLPCIRKHEAYMTPGKLMEALQKPETIMQTLQMLANEQLKNSELIRRVETLEETVSVQQSQIKTQGELIEYMQHEAKQWGRSQILNALVRSYAAHIPEPEDPTLNRYSLAWSRWRSSMNYRLDINLKRRRGKNLSDKIREDEWTTAISIAVDMWYTVADGNISKVINEVNKERVKNMGIDIIDMQSKQ